MKIIHSDKAKYELKLMLYHELVNLYNKSEIVIPSWQRTLDDTKINEISTYAKTNPNFFIFQTNPIQIISLTNSNGTYNFVVDGQHRLKAVIKNYDLGIDNYIMVAYTFCSTIQEVENIYKMINIDTPNMAIPFDEISKEFKKNSYVKLRFLINDQYKEYFGTNKDKYRYSLDEFVGLLRENKFLEYLEYEDLQETLEYLRLENNSFYDSYGYDKIISHSITTFYEKEIQSIQAKIIFTLRRNNFIDYLFNSGIKPIHQQKYVKTKISKPLRETVWKKYKGICKLCNKQIVDKENDYHCGHIKSEYNGGKTELNNLTVLCKKCNLELGANDILLITSN
jgi:hypothetical protein